LPPVLSVYTCIKKRAIERLYLSVAPSLAIWLAGLQVGFFIIYQLLIHYKFAVFRFSYPVKLVIKLYSNLAIVAEKLFK
jgi:hypothetical protein